MAGVVSVPGGRGRAGKPRLPRGLVPLGAGVALVGGLLAAPASQAATPGVLATADLSTTGVEALAQALAGPGVTVSGVTFTGAPVAAGTFTGGTGIIGFESGVVLSSGNVADVVGPNTHTGTTTQNARPGDAQLDLLAGNTTRDAAVLEFDVVPDKDTLQFNYVFSSEEYNEYVGSQYNDVFAFFVNGTNCALLPGTTTPVAINTVNAGSNAGAFVDNVTGQLNTEMDGLTVVLSCVAPVKVGEANHIKLAIADTSDSVLDSAVFLQAGSFSTDPVPVDQQPTLTVPPQQSVQYSDPLSFGVSATDPEGKPVTLAASGLPAGLSFAGAGDGTGAVSGTVTDTPGSYVATFSATDGTTSPVTGTTTVAVEKEQCTLTYAGPVLGSATQTTPLVADLGETDTSLGDRSGKSVVFTTTNTAGATQTFTATTDGNGRATVNAPLGAEVYGVTASFAGDTHYLACAAQEALVTVQSAQAKVTGGGWFAVSTGRTAFGFNAVSDVTGMHGQFQLRSANKDKFHGTSVSSLNAGSGKGTWSGAGRWNGVPGYRFTVTVTDTGSGKKGADTVSIVVTDTAGKTVYSSGAQPLKGGNITVH